MVQAIVFSDSAAEVVSPRSLTLLNPERQLDLLRQSVQSADQGEIAVYNGKIAVRTEFQVCAKLLRRNPRTCWHDLDGNRLARVRLSPPWWCCEYASVTKYIDEDVAVSGPKLREPFPKSQQRSEVSHNKVS